jgi:hypothetical protein
MRPSAKKETLVKLVSDASSVVFDLKTTVWVAAV